MGSERARESARLGRLLAGLARRQERERGRAAWDYHDLRRRVRAELDRRRPDRPVGPAERVL